ncbi:MAG: hypothetical protein HZA28_05110 [Candidatus Omnitrophica bacterium]|nr:hypothetical protein [Candidatus Omnitrophota bacterium]
MAGHSLKNKKILITCGPTWVPIDDVRVLSNQSTGALGQQIALDCARAGARVVLLEGPVQRPLSSEGIRTLKFSFLAELEGLVKKELRKDTAVVVHAAAVADYQLKRPVRGKIPSGRKTLKLELTATPKIIRSVKRLNPKALLVGFKLEPKISRRSAVVKTRDLFRNAGCDLVVANQLTARGYRGYILDQNKKELAYAASRREMSAALVRILRERL